MSDRSNYRVWSDHDIVADTNFGNIKNCQVVVSGKIVPDINVFSVVAVKSLCNPDFFADTS